MSTPIWQPSAERRRNANLTRFMDWLSPLVGRDFDGYEALRAWSVEQPEEFWRRFWDFAGVQAENRGRTVLADGDRMPGARWFPEARLNFAANLLKYRDDGTALVFRGEDKVQQRLSRNELYRQVAAAARQQAKQDTQQ